MKNRILILVILISGAFLYPFGCEGQTKTLPVDPDGCDTVFIESPEIQKCADDLAGAQIVIDNLNTTISDKDAIIVVKTAQVANLDTKVAALNTTIGKRDATIRTNEAAIQGLNEDLAIQNDLNAAKDVIIERRDVTINEMQVLLDAKPTTETVYVEKDSITVGGKDYKVSEIDVILPTQSIDTIFLNTCYAQTDTNKVWYHGGDIDAYPHIIYFPTKELSMIGVQFNEKLTDDMKKYQTKFTVKRIRNHEDATTKYVNIPVDPSEYLPKN